MFLVPQFAAGVPAVAGVPIGALPPLGRAGDGQSSGTGNGGRP